ncbi:MAG: indolepyruvate ferredoxin oxidoreductase family protein [Acidimicrobiales bacterium]
MTLSESYRLHDRYLADDGTVFLTGIQALARLPLEQLRADRRAGLRTAAFVSGYQGSPLGGYGETVRDAAALAPELPIVVRPALNEEYGATAVMGSQLASVQPDCRYDGVVGIWYGKAPGVDRAADALRHAVYTGTAPHGGAVAIVGDDPAAKSSTIPSSSASLLAAMHVPILYPGDPAEALKLGRHAVALSRATGLWVALKIVADVADATATMSLRPEAFQPVLPQVDGRPYEHRPDGRLLTPHTLGLEREIVEVRYELARRYAVDNALNYLTADPADAWIVIVASGISYREVTEAFARLGLRGEQAIADCGIRLLKMGMPLPFNASVVRHAARGVHEVLVVEEKAPTIESLIKDALYDLDDRPRVVGKVDDAGRELCPAYGALDADALVGVLRRRLGATLGDRLAPEQPQRQRIRLTLEPLPAQRAPFFCSGCPHNRSTVVPDGTLVGAGIGCHTMTLLMDPDRVGDIAAITCMGNEGTQWIGMADFVERSHFVQNLGDGTYFHSGRLAITAAVAAGVTMTYKLLYNGTVAMTGGQDPTGQRDVPDVVRQLLDDGVARVLITAEDTERYLGVTLPAGVAVWPRERLLEAQELLATVPGVTVLIHDQACAAEARRSRKRTPPATTRRVVINPRVCEGCGHCGRISNCLSVQPIETAFGPRTHIDQTTCNLDASCLEGDCPSFVTVTTSSGARRRWRRAARRVTRRFDAVPGRAEPHGTAEAGVGRPAPTTALPDPVVVVPAEDFAMRITGIGGTGVVTVAQVLGTAAMLSGYHVRGLDQIGLSQKAGPVVSDVRLSTVAPTATNRLGEGQADLLLALDQLVAASDKGLLTADPGRTTVVGSTSPTPTGEMITHLDVHLPPAGELSTRIATLTRADAQHWADAQAITTDLFGSATTANLFVVGMAVQAGCLPLPPADIEAAIALNGVAVQANIEAFRWGRTQIVDPSAVRAARHAAAGAKPPVDEAGRAAAAPAPPPSGGRSGGLPDAVAAGLGALGLEADDRLAATRFAAELQAWGGDRPVRRWWRAVEAAAQAERRAVPGSTALTMAVAANLFKLLAYKDEYEVARLLLDDEALDEVRSMAGPDDMVAWQLHPPLLRNWGLDRKIAIGTWAAPALRALSRGRVLRGTPLDPFGRAEVRKVERTLPTQYEAAIETVCRTLDADRLAAAVAIAALPDLVRGYEDIKLDSVARYRTALSDALAAYPSATPTPAASTI